MREAFRESVFILLSYQPFLVLYAFLKVTFWLGPFLEGISLFFAEFAACSVVWPFFMFFMGRILPCLSGVPEITWGFDCFLTDCCTS